MTSFMRAMASICRDGMSSFYPSSRSLRSRAYLESSSPYSDGTDFDKSLHGRRTRFISREDLDRERSRSRSRSRHPRRSKSRESQKRRHEEQYDYAPTYGTFMFHRTDKRGPDDCKCSCCPHSYAGARRASGSGQTFATATDKHLPSRLFGSGNDKDAMRRRNSTSSQNGSVSSPQRYSGHDESGRERQNVKRKPKKSILILNQTKGSLWKEYGPRFNVKLGRRTTTESILNFLAPDRRRYKVLVHWHDDTMESLDESISVSELQKYADSLEVKKQKHVRFA